MQGNTPSSYHNEYPQSKQESLELVPETLCKKVKKKSKAIPVTGRGGL
jgi:hypothetical protein